MAKNGSSQPGGVYRQIRRVSVAGILVTLVLTLGAALWLTLTQESGARDRALTTATQAAANTMQAMAAGGQDRTVGYYRQMAESVPDVDLFACYTADGTPADFYDVVSGQSDPAALAPLDAGLMDRLNATGAALLDNAQAPGGSDHCAYAVVRLADGTVAGYVMAGVYLRSIRQTVLATLAAYLAIGAAALAIGAALSLQLARRIKTELLGYEPDAFRDLFLRRMELLDALDEGLLAIDRDRRVIYINRAAAELLSLDKAASLGRLLEEVRPQSSIARVLRTGKAEYGVSVQTKRRIRVISDRMPVRRDGKLVGAVAIFRNRTEVARLARELTGVQHIVEAMRAYTHEFMNKLHVILGLLQLGEAGRAEEYVLQLTRTRALSTSAISERIAEPSVAALLIGKSCRAAELGVRMTLDPESRLPAEPYCLPASAIITILGNLIENAFDAFSAMPAGGGHQVDVSIRESAGGLLLSVDDNGPGMPPELAAHIFEQGATTKGEGRGTGLFLVKRITDAFHGEARVESTQGVGSSFIVAFRREETDEAPDAGGSSLTAPDGADG